MKTEVISMADISKAIINGCEWNEEEFRACLELLSYVVITPKHKKEIFEYFNNKAPEQFKIKKFKEFKQLLNKK